MRPLACIPLLTLPAVLAGVEVWSVDLDQDDKRKHVAGGAVIAGVTSALVRDMPLLARLLIPVATTAVLGEAKELTDKLDPRHHTSDVRDFRATVMGGG